MTAPVASFHVDPVALSQEQYGVTMRKNLANSTDHASASRRWFRNLLYKAFPSPSDCDLADKAARDCDGNFASRISHAGGAYLSDFGVGEIA